MRTSHYAQLSAILVEARTSVAATVDGVAARVLHAANLPAGTDVNSHLRQRVALGLVPAAIRSDSAELVADVVFQADPRVRQRVGGFRGEQHGVPPQFWLKALRTAKSA